MASISRMASGKWRARYRPIPTANQKSRIFDTRRDAQRWLDEVTASMVTGQYVDPLAGKITFAAFYEQWSARKTWAPGTTLAMNLAAESVTFGRVRMSSLRASHVESWVKSMIDRGLAPGTIKTRFNNVRAVLRAAVRDRMIPSDPAIGVDLPRTRRAESSMQLPTVEQVGALLGSADDNFKAFIGLCAFAGLRLGEAAALQVGDIDFLRTKSLRVTRQVQRAVAGQVDIRSPKYGSERTVYVPDDLLALLAQHIATYRPGTDPSRWMFEGNYGDPPHQNTVGYWWRRAKAAAGVDGVRLHDLRHFYASGLIADGCDVVTVQRALGHSKASITLDTYSHLWPTAEDRTRQAAASLMTAARISEAGLRHGRKANPL